MSEAKITSAAQGAATSANMRANVNEASAGATGVSKFTPTINVFAPNSTSAFTFGSGVNVTVPLVPLVQAFVEGGGFYDYPVEITKSLIVLSSDRETGAWLRGRFPAAVESAALHVIAPLTVGPTNFFQLEGRALLSAGIKPHGEVLILILPAVDRKNLLARKELVPLLEAAHSRCRTVIVAFQGLSGDDAACLKDYFDVVLKIENCEPDHGYMSAFTITPAPGTLLAAVGKRPVIDNIRLGAKGQIERHFYECVSPNAMTREIAKLVEQGKSYNEIAEQYEVNKTTIMRRIDALPFRPRRPSPKMS
jgi:hypothetical protein